MKIKIGDSVRFLNAVGGGLVTKIKGETAHVLSSEDDFEYPTLISELIKIETATPAPTSGSSSGNRSLGTPVTPSSRTIGAIEEDDEAVEMIDGNDLLKLYAAFVPTEKNNPTNCDLDLYLINDSNFHIFYTYLLPAANGRYEYRKSGKIEPNSKWPIDTLKRSEISKLSELLFQCLPYNRSTYAPVKPIHKHLKVPTVSFFKHGKYKENDFFHEDAIICEITDDEFKKAVDNIPANEIQRVLKEQQRANKTIDKSLVSKQKKESTPDEIIIDLHLHELIDNEAGMSKQDMLDLQIKTFESELATGLKSNSKRIVFIHGVGNGTLKLELRKKLDRSYKKVRYQDASFAEYGWGATLIFLK